MGVEYPVGSGGKVPVATWIQARAAIHHVAHQTRIFFPKLYGVAIAENLCERNNYRFS